MKKSQISYFYLSETNFSRITRNVSAHFFGGGIVGVTSGCSSMAPSDKTQTMSVYALGIPGIAIISESRQTADNAGSDLNAAAQSNSLIVK